MHSMAYLAISFALLINALPQTSPKAPSQGKGGKGGTTPGAGLLAGLIPRTPAGADGPDLRGFATFLKDASIPRLLGSLGITGLEPLWKVPEIQKYAPSYMDFRNRSNLPFVMAMPNGPAPTGCSPYEMLIARGTGELGDFGFIVGDPLLKTVRQAIPEVRGYAVQYPANMNASSSKIGAEDVIARLRKQHKECPTQKFAVVGYSQGSMVMRRALGDAKQVGESAYKQIVAGAMFGGPKGGQSFGGKGGAPKGSPTAGGTPPARPKMVSPKFDMGLEEKVRWNCAKGDPACTPGSANIIMHLTYNNPDGNFMSESAAWITAGFKGGPVPPKGSS